MTKPLGISSSNPQSQQFPNQKLHVLKLISETSMPNTIVWHMQCYSLRRTTNVKIPGDSLRYNCQKICSRMRRFKSVLKIRKNKSYFSWWSTRLLFLVSRNFTSYRKRIYRPIVSGRKPLHNFIIGATEKTF